MIHFIFQFLESVGVGFGVVAVCFLPTLFIR